jgi:voltage-gated potassium channel
MDSVHAIRQEYGDLIYGFEIFFTVTFSIEYVLRVQCLRHPREYICSVMGLVDISSILPTFISAFHCSP